MNLLKGVKKMNKEEFLKKLSKKLDILEDKEIDDIISEYQGYIEEKVATGMNEEEAVKELGDFDEIVSDLLAAYKVKTPPKEEWTFNKFFAKINKAIDVIIDSFQDKSAKDIVKVLIEIIIILFLICLLKIPFSMLKDLGSNIFHELSNPLGNIFGDIWRFLIEISYLITAIIFFIKIFERRYFKDFSAKIVESQEETPKEKKNNNPKIVPTPKPEKQSPIDTLANICILFLKFIVIIFLLGVICYLLGITVALGFMIYLIIRGVTYFGILILLIALFLSGAFLLEIGLNFCMNKKIRPFSFFCKLITLIIITGFGLTLSAIEIANTEIIYDNYYQETKSITQEIPMTENLVLYNYDKIVIDNTLQDKVKIEYIYPDFNNNMQVSINLDTCNTGYCLHTNISHMNWNKEILDDIINNLKAKKIYTYDFYVEKIIYTSQENANLLQRNIQSNSNYTFTKTYNVLDVQNLNDFYLYLTLNQSSNPEIETVKVLENRASFIESGNTYNFTFTCPNIDILDEDIEEIFEECTLIEIQ